MSYDVIRHAIKHSDEDPDILTDDDVEIIEAPYPENGKAQIPKRSFIYDDEDGYPQDYFEHHGILGMKWGVRRYQNADGSLTPAGVKRYGKQVKRHNENINYAMYKRSLPKVSAEDRINRELKRGKIDEQQANKLRQAANNLTSYYDFLSDQSVLSKEIEYDDMQKYIIDNFGKTSLEEVNKWASSHLNSRTFDRATKNVEDYEKLREENNKLLEEENKPSNSKGTYVIAKPGELPESTRVTGKEESDFWKAYAKEVAPKESSSSNKPVSSTGTYEQRRSAYISEHKSQLLKDAKEKDSFDMEFLESNRDTDRDGNHLEGKALIDAYEKYLDEEIKKGK